MGSAVSCGVGLLGSSNLHGCPWFYLQDDTPSVSLIRTNKDRYLPSFLFSILSLPDTVLILCGEHFLWLRAAWSVNVYVQLLYFGSVVNTIVIAYMCNIL